MSMQITGNVSEVDEMRHKEQATKNKPIEAGVSPWDYGANLKEVCVSSY